MSKSEQPTVPARSGQWIRRRVRLAVGLVLRGACTGLGTAGAGMVVVWLQTRG